MNATKNRHMMDYKDYLVNTIQSYRGEFHKIIYYIPHFFSLLCDLLNEKNLPTGVKPLINAALAYFVTPVDVIPEEIYGPYGYIDDIFVCCHVLKKIKAKIGIKKLESLWHHEEELPLILDECYKVSAEYINKKKLKKEIFDYIGLD